MRLLEITGDTESDVYGKLRHIYFILNSVNGVTLNKSTELLRDQSLHELMEDPVNLNYWILASERISALYNEIKNVS